MIPSKLKILESLKLALEGKYDELDLVRLVCSFEEHSRIENPNIFNYFIGVASETDDLPTIDQKQLYKASYYSELEKQKNEYFTRIRSKLLSNISELIKELEKE